MATRFHVMIYSTNDFHPEQEFCRRAYGQDYLELVGLTTVTAVDPRFAAAMAYSRTCGKRYCRFLRELGRAPDILDFYTTREVWRHLRRSWFFSKQLRTHFQFERREPAMNLYCTVRPAHSDQASVPRRALYFRPTYDRRTFSVN